jgi:DNA repair exonuclease SbcCD ATPase subunit
MKIKRIQIKNILGLEELEIEPGIVTVISGGNETGKTSTLEAIRATLGRGNDATLLRKGAEAGEVVLELDDDTVIKNKVTDKCSRTVTHPKFGRLSKGQTILESLNDSLGINPIQFLLAKPEARLNLFLEAIPLKLTADQLRDMPIETLREVDLDQHALQVIAKLSKMLYDERTGVNRVVKDKETTARQMRDSLPAKPEDGDWNKALQEAGREFQQLQKDSLLRANGIKDDARAAVDAAKSLFFAHKIRVERELSAAIEDLRAKAEAEIRRADEACAKEMEEISHHRDERLSAADKEYQPRHQELSEKIGQARAMMQAHERSKSALEYITRLESEAKTADEQSLALTTQIKKLESLKLELLKQLPIPGAEVKDGDIYIDDIPFDRVNNSRRVKFAMQLAMLRKSPLIIVDSIEQLDQSAFEAFKKEAFLTGKRNGVQFILSRVTEGALQIETNGEEMTAC